MHCHWGVIGAGFIATHAVIPAIQHLPNAHVLAVASSNRERAQSTATQFAIERIYDDYSQLLADPDINAIYIALPNHLHHEWTIRAAQAGKHVLCEKPLAMTAAECDGMIAACQQAHALSETLAGIRRMRRDPLCA
jgi:xylose dehydrogenase (NAD/NADP)